MDLALKNKLIVVTGGGAGIGAAISRACLAEGARVVVLADHTKMGRADFAFFAPLSDVDTVITDTGVAPELVEEIEAAGPRVVRA